eukprot:Gregarina_sp_Poly_1__2595@NODE_1704_length_3512_cov_48_744267_g1094_i1_p2_GENE_NODE_1704_length_3512_cov_48_744267_g1094_i1NODE_1704_length_3512_cov_48_744267_g1094_i1_p2_ORF_typecomplete_len214_score36_38Kinesin/PF00225_23/6_6e36Microtub_bd/PF16796_5/5_5e21T2SSE/PF00437_20/0_0014AAA_16/PF13191_6/0_021Cdd1/PF11731_8/5_9e03Cdd1/PF11731_8/0_091AAA_24/PF13479_6/0_049AAA_22/PF13401_6/4_4e03AAA_22/PF13401_6/0_11DUF815/PF05673_13/0_11DUF927/PF06048_11/0_18DUF87/PF01935_17/3_6e03DUF87/PF01935_17/0_77DU
MESIAKNVKRVFSPPVAQRELEKSPGDDGRIRVFVRFREDFRTDSCILRDPDDPRSVIYVPSQVTAHSFQRRKLDLKLFSFDDVLDSQASQEKVFDAVAKPVVDRFLQGFNGAILAYGQSGSGKTYTIEGTLTDHHRRGLVARTGEALFQHLRDIQGSAIDKCILEASLIEIYCEKLRDLLAKENDKQSSLHIREDLNGNTELEGAIKVRDGT